MSRNKNTTIRKIITALKLQPLPGEGGYFKETYRSNIAVPLPLKGDAQPAMRQLATAIYYLITPKEFSALHKLKSDEIFHFYAGDPVEMIQVSETGEVKTIILGRNILKGQQVRAIVPAGTWQASRLIKGGRYALLGTTVFPAFEFDDFTLAKRNEMYAQFPHLTRLIKKLTRE
jgi:predicted cupin superfamily sugar epimerase